MFSANGRYINSRTVIISIALLVGVVFQLFFPHVIHAQAANLEKGITEYNAENYEEAMVFFKKALQDQATSSLASFYLGLTYKQVGNFSVAADHFRKAISLAPPVKEAYVELIEMLYNLNNNREAMEWVEASERENIKPAHVAFLKGAILLKENKNREAVESFRKAKAADAVFAQAADFQIAMALVKERKIAEARKSLNAVIAIDPSSELAGFAKDYENSIAAAMEKYKTWRFALGAGYQFDTNVISKPSTSLGVDLIDHALGKKDSSIFNTFRVEYAPMPEGSWFFNAQYNFYTNNYFNHYTYKNDIINNTVTAMPGLNFQDGTLTFPLSYNHVWLGNNEYMKGLSWKPTLSIVTGSGLLWQVAAGVSDRKMLNPLSDDRSGKTYTASLGYLYPFHEGKGMVNLKYEYSWDDAKGQDWDNNGQRASLNLLLPLKDNVGLIMSGDLFVQKYDNDNSVWGVNGFPSGPTRRFDRIYTGSAGILWNLFDGLNLNLLGTYTRADSNFAVYDYERTLYSLGLEYNF